MRAKRFLVLAALALVLFLVISRPNQAANATREGWSWLGDGADAVVTFFTSVFNH